MSKYLLGLAPYNINGKYRVGSNFMTGLSQLTSDTVFPRIIAWGNFFFFFTPKGGDYSREGDYLRQRWQLFQIFLIGGPALNILFYYTIKSKKTNHIKCNLN